MVLAGLGAGSSSQENNFGRSDFGFMTVEL